MASSKDFLVKQLTKIKNDYEKTITRGGESAKIKKIRTSTIIQPIHEFVKHEFKTHGVSPTKILPPIRRSKPEVRLSGYLKSKKQDITVLPSKPHPEVIRKNSILIGDKDHVGMELMNKSISVNVRSQLSSLTKNFDTLFERTFAEALNLHLRTPNIILGELYLVPLEEYDQAFSKKHQIKFGKILSINYLRAFDAINNRNRIENFDYKYERAVLLIVDFKPATPKIMTKKDLVALDVYDRGIIEDIHENLFDPYTLIPDLLNIYKRRHRISELMD